MMPLLKCVECGNVNDDNGGKPMCATCEDWVVTEHQPRDHPVTCRRCFKAQTGNYSGICDDCDTILAASYAALVVDREES